MEILTYSGAVNLLVGFDMGRGPLDSADFDDLSFMSLLISGSNSGMGYAEIVLSTAFLDIAQAREEAGPLQDAARTSLQCHSVF